MTIQLTSRTVKMADKKSNIIESANYLHHQELGGIEMLDASYHKQCFFRHSHEGYTFGIIEKGAQKFFRTGVNNIAPTGSIILINADDIHNGEADTEEGWAYKALYPYFPDAVIHDEELAAQFRLVYQVLIESDNNLLRESLLYSLLIKLMAKHGKSRINFGPDKTASKQVTIVKDFLDDLPDANVSLNELAQLVSLNPYYLVRLFKKEFGLPPHAYQIQSRLRYATRLIKEGNKLADVAIQSGFHDQSHFIKHFKKAMGVTPRQYAKHFLS
ncbi:AraC family transcriptional regulator [Photobacterium damselae]|uniref:helix-turn-helix transcriptional regulator n=1 Tax=Photobacterium damselae TaxID=38293 RepID=UPI003F6286B5